MDALGGQRRAVRLMQGDVIHWRCSIRNAAIIEYAGQSFSGVTVLERLTAGRISVPVFPKVGASWRRFLWLAGMGGGRRRGFGWCDGRAHPPCDFPQDHLQGIVLVGAVLQAIDHGFEAQFQRVAQAAEPHRGVAGGVA